jgi:hypothetical protein
MWGHFMAFEGRHHSSIFLGGQNFEMQRPHTKKKKKEKKRKKGSMARGYKGIFWKKSSISGSHISRV